LILKRGDENFIWSINHDAATAALGQSLGIVKLLPGGGYFQSWILSQDVDYTILVISTFSKEEKHDHQRQALIWKNSACDRGTYNYSRIR
jgi:hypothetical protein